MLFLSVWQQASMFVNISEFTEPGALIFHMFYLVDRVFQRYIHITLPFVLLLIYEDGITRNANG